MIGVEVEPREATMAPVGGLVRTDDLADDEIAWFGDDEIAVAVDSQGRPTVPDQSETVRSRWIGECSGEGMFQLIGTLHNLEQGVVAIGSTNNWLLLTDSFLRGTIPWYKSHIRTAAGIVAIPQGFVFAFGLPLVDVELIDGNKNDIAVASRLDGVVVKWVCAVDDAWTKSGSKNPWHKDNALFAQAVMQATIAAKQRHPDEAVRASAAQATRDVDSYDAFARRRRTTVEFVAPR